MLFRRVNASDIPGILKLASEAGVGLTTLPYDEDLICARVQRACASFEKEVTSPADESYFFVLEDPQTQTVVGTAAIEAYTGSDLPFYSYKRSQRTRVCHSLNIRSDYEVLSLVNDLQGQTELCTLFLSPHYRINGNGLLLSRARFLFMAAHRARFGDSVIAEMRGVSDDNGQSPFWDHVMSHFFKMPFKDADRLTVSTNKQFIADLMPRNPIYVCLLDERAQAVIGQPHTATVPALNILLQEGFEHSRYVDIFDAGPTIKALTQNIRTIKENRVYTISHFCDEVESPRYLIANPSLDFKATIGHVLIDEHHGTCIITKALQDLLQFKIDDPLSLSPLSYSHAKEISA